MKAERPISATERELHERYREQREQHRPPCCNFSLGCRVEVGPPAMSRSGRCLACNGVPTLALARDMR